MKKIPFMKFSGAGNDFIVIDNRRRIIEPKAMASFVAHVCRHHLLVGADGLIFIEKSRGADSRWRFFNDDGGEADFCGNGARCAARFAYLKKIATKAMRFEGKAGTVEAEVHGYRVTVRVPDPSAAKVNLHIPIDGTPHEGHSINTGVPHCVYFVPNTVQADVVGIGRATRFHDVFDPEGRMLISPRSWIVVRFTFGPMSAVSKRKPWLAAAGLSRRLSSRRSCTKWNHLSRSSRRVV